MESVHSLHYNEPIYSFGGKLEVAEDDGPLSVVTPYDVVTVRY